MKISSSCKMFAIVALLAAGVGLSTTAVSARAPQVQSAASKPYTVKAKIAGAKNKTVLLVAKTGRVLASKKITSDTAFVVTLTTPLKPKITTLAGATLQLVSSTTGDYFGPILLGWYGSSRTSASKVYTKFSSSAPTTIDLKTITIKSVSKKQGYGYTAISSSQVDKTTASTTKATKGVPKGVGNYGKATTASASALFVTGNRSPMAPPQPPQPPPGGGGAKVNVDDLDGGDDDDDGIPNAFDVNDDGDAVLDQADANNPAPNAGANCQAGASFNIFTNFKNTATNLAGNLNAYGSGDSLANESKIANALTNTMSIVMQPIATVCGSSVVKSEFKGVGTLPYAPADYVDITGKSGGTGDYQWTVGNGQISGNAITGLAAYTFKSPNEISGQDVLMQRVTTADGNVYEFAGTMGFVFVTHPLPLRYSIDNGASWSNFTFSGGSATYGTSQKIALANNTKLTVEFAVPQRLAFDGEGGSYWDLGNMTYSPDAPNAFGGGGGPGKCDSQAATDATADSAVAASARVFQLGFTLGTCFSEKSKSWGTTGQELQGGVDIQVVPAGGGGNSAQKLGISAQ